MVEDIRAQWFTRSQDDTHCEMKRTTVRCTATRCYIMRDEEIKLMKHSLTHSLQFSWRLYSLFYIDLLRSWVDTVTHTLTRWCTHTEKRAHSPMQWLSCLLRRCYLLHTEVSPFMQTGSLNRPCSHAYIHMVVTLAGTLLLSFTSSYSRGCTHSHAHLYHFCAKLHFQHSVRRRGAEWIHACVYQV